MASGSDEDYARNLYKDDMTAHVVQRMSSVPTESIVGNRDALLAWQMQNQEINGFKDRKDNICTDVMDGNAQDHHRLQTDLRIPVQESMNYDGSVDSRKKLQRKEKKKRKKLQNSALLSKSQQGKPITQVCNGDNANLNSSSSIHVGNFFPTEIELEEDSAPAPENLVSSTFNTSVRFPSRRMHQTTFRQTNDFAMSRSNVNAWPQEHTTALNPCEDNFIGENSSVGNGRNPSVEYDEILAQDLGRNLQMDLERRDAELAQRLEEEERNVFRNDFDSFSGHNNRHFNHIENDARMIHSNRATRNRDNPFLHGRRPFHLHRMYTDGIVRHRTPPTAYPMFLHDHDVFDPEEFVMSAMGMPRDLLGLQIPHLHGSHSQTMDFNDYEALWDLAERIGDAKSSGMSEKALSELKTFKFQDGADEGENNNCIICLSEFSHGDLLTLLNCQHTFHKKCIETWLKKKAVCPVCRENFQEKRLEK